LSILSFTFYLITQVTFIQQDRVTFICVDARANKLITVFGAPDLREE